jgi:hypothetical protein
VVIGLAVDRHMYEPEVGVAQVLGQPLAGDERSRSSGIH